MKHILDISSEELEKMSGTQRINGYLYSKEDIIAIQNKIKDIINNIPKIRDINNKEKEIFSYVYTYLSKTIAYDYETSDLMDIARSGYGREMISNRVEDDSGLKGLITGKTICKGYSNILKEILYYLGIDCKVISATGSYGGHAWNQVFLDGKWYNCDLTNDYDFILSGLRCMFFLKSDDNFDRYEKYPKLKTEKVDCNESVSDEEQEKLLNHAYEYVSQLIDIKEEYVTENHNKENNFIKNLKNYINCKIGHLKKAGITK